jgi:hypothetical protein
MTQQGWIVQLTAIVNPGDSVFSQTVVPPNGIGSLGHVVCQGPTGPGQIVLSALSVGGAQTGPTGPVDAYGFATTPPGFTMGVSGITDRVGATGPTGATGVTGPLSLGGIAVQPLAPIRVNGTVASNYSGTLTFTMTGTLTPLPH